MYKKLFISIGVLLIIGASYLLIYEKSEKLNEPPSWRGITPSVTSKKEVIDKLEEPDLKYEKEEELILSWNIEGEKVIRNTIAFTSDNKVKYILIADPDYLEINSEKGLLRKFGSPEKKAKSSFAQWSYNYAYPNQGISYIIDFSESDQGEIKRKILFKPMSLENYENMFTHPDVTWEE